MTPAGRRGLRVVAVCFVVFLTVVLVAAVLVRFSRPEEDGDRPSDSGERPGEVSAPSTMHPLPMAGRDESGAVAAALSYATAPQDWLYITDPEITTAVRAVATPEAADRLSTEVVEDIRAARSELADAPGRVWWIVHPLAWRSDSYGEDEATVSVWTVSVLSAADVAVPQTDWMTITLDLTWMDDGWRVDAVRDTVGPTPAVGPEDQPWEPEPFDDALDGFTRIEWGPDR